MAEITPKSVKRRASYSLAKKMDIIIRIENGDSQIKASKDMGMAYSTVQQIWRNRDKIKSTCKSTKLDFKRITTCEFPIIDNMLLEWFNLQRHRNVPVSGPLLIEKSLQIAREKGESQFKASRGWLDNWKRRHGIVFKSVAGEENAVDVTHINDWFENVWVALCSKYEPKDIFNADETGLFFRVLPEKTFEYKGKTCHGGKKSKDRLSVLFCANATGCEKLKPLVICKSAKVHDHAVLRE